MSGTDKDRARVLAGLFGSTPNDGAEALDRLVGERDRYRAALEHVQTIIGIYDQSYNDEMGVSAEESLQAIREALREEK